jgi:O-antigen/teichoic acid export membrane protein
MTPHDTLTIERSAHSTQRAAEDARSIVENRSIATSSRNWLQSALAALAGGSVFHKGVLSLFDQGVVSAVNFLTMVLVGRAVGQEFVGKGAEHELGLYQLGFSIVVLATTVQNALICAPYAVFGNRLTGDERARYAGSALLHQGMFSAIASLGLALVGAVVALGLGGGGFQRVAWVLAVMLPMLLAREFVRRVAFAHLQVITVLALDLTVAILQLGALVTLKILGNLTAVTGFAASGLACGLAAAAVFFVMRGQFAPRRTSALADLGVSWSFGRWAFAAQVVYLAMFYGVSWLLALVGGTTAEERFVATGRLAACMSLIMIANPLLIGLNNFLSPQAIAVYANHGLPALARLTWRTAVVLTAGVSILVAGLVLAGGQLLTFVYGTNFPGQGQIVAILAFNLLMYGLSMSAENALVALNRPDAVFWANLAGLAVTFGVGGFLIGAHSVVGAAFASLIGVTTCTLGKGIFYEMARRKSCQGRS